MDLCGICGFVQYLVVSSCVVQYLVVSLWLYAVLSGKFVVLCCVSSGLAQYLVVGLWVCAVFVHL